MMFRPHLLLHIFLLALSILPNSFCYNYLVVSPAFGHSHSTFMGKIADTLKEAGHSVTLLSLEISPATRNVAYTKLATDVVYVETTPEIVADMQKMQSGDFSRFWSEEGGLFDTIPSFLAIIDLLDKVQKNLKNNVDILDKLQATRPKFDAITFETYMFVGRVVQDYLGIEVYLPVVSITHDTKTSVLLGEPIMPSYLSGYFTNFGNVMTFKERTINTMSYVLGNYYLQYPKWKKLQDPTQDLSIKGNYYQSPYLFINSNPYIDFPRPMIPKTIQVGGITVDVAYLKSHKVDHEWNGILDRRPHNVLISFGSLFHSMYMPDHYKENIVKVIKSLPNVTFIWKYETEEVGFAAGAENIVFSKWVPQTALLADSRLSAFLTHGGLGSVNELSYMGKPSILCPLFGDQLRNAKMLARHNGSIEISKFDLPNFANLRSALHRILFDESYQRNAENLAKRLEKQPFKPKEMLVRHFEFGAEFGIQPGLDCNIRNMTFAEYFLLDVLAFFATCATVIIVLVYLVLKRVVSVIKSVRSKSKLE